MAEEQAIPVRNLPAYMTRRTTIGDRLFAIVENSTSEDRDVIEAAKVLLDNGYA